MTDPHRSQEANKPEGSFEELCFDSFNHLQKAAYPNSWAPRTLGLSTLCGRVTLDEGSINSPWASTYGTTTIMPCSSVFVHPIPSNSSKGQGVVPCRWFVDQRDNQHNEMVTYLTSTYRRLEYLPSRESKILKGSQEGRNSGPQSQGLNQ